MSTSSAFRKIVFLQMKPDIYERLTYKKVQSYRSRKRAIVLFRSGSSSSLVAEAMSDARVSIMNMCGFTEGSLAGAPGAGATFTLVTTMFASRLLTEGGCVVSGS